MKLPGRIKLLNMISFSIVGLKQIAMIVHELFVAC